jgi:transposase
MGRRSISIERQEDKEQALKQAYQRSTCAVERRRIQVIRMMRGGKSREEIKEVTAYSDVSIIEGVKRYNAEGLAGLKDQRHENPGAEPWLSDEQLLNVAQVVRKDYARGVLWNGQKVLDWLKEEYDLEVYPQRAFEFLKQISMSQQVPPPRHRKADEVAQDTFKKNTTRSG